MANQTELLNVSDEMKLNDKQQIIEGQEHDEELCSSSLDTTEELYSSSAPDTCGNSGSADEKSPVNQRFPPIWGKNGCVFQFPQNGYEGIDLPQG